MGGVFKPAGRPLSTLTAELRTVLTPVLGYLDLILDDQILGDEHEDGAKNHPNEEWLCPMERQLRRLREVSEELIAVCETWRAKGPAAAEVPERLPDTAADDLERVTE